MRDSILQCLRSFMPQQSAVDRFERMRACASLAGLAGDRLCAACYRDADQNRFSASRRAAGLFAAGAGVARFAHSGKAEVVGQIMTPCVQTVSASAPIVQLVSLMADQGVHQIPVLDDERKLVGMVTQSDMVAALYVINLRQLSGMP